VLAPEKMPLGPGTIFKIRRKLDSLSGFKKVFLVSDKVGKQPTHLEF